MLDLSLTHSISHLADPISHAHQAVVLGLMRGGVPLTILHSQGCGAKHPLGDPSKNRRVEIHVIDSEELQNMAGRRDQERAAAIAFGGLGGGQD
jgi:hypothetical protein